MFDFHMHSRVSFDSKADPMDMVRAAKAMGLKEICFTDHLDYTMDHNDLSMVFDRQVYDTTYDALQDPEILIRRGFEFNIGRNNHHLLQQEVTRRDYDFVLGSVHFVGTEDVYMKPYWEARTPQQAALDYLQETLDRVREHRGYDVLAHLTYLSKSPSNPQNAVLHYVDYREVADEILKILAQRGIGLEVNTSGVDVTGDFLPTMDYVRRFKELGGQIVTVGSDAHAPHRVGQYTHRVCQLLKDIFGYVCTFEQRQPVFHKL